MQTLPLRAARYSLYVCFLALPYIALTNMSLAETLLVYYIISLFF